MRRVAAMGSPVSRPTWTECSELHGVQGGRRPERSEGAPKAQSAVELSPTLRGRESGLFAFVLRG